MTIKGAVRKAGRSGSYRGTRVAGDTGVGVNIKDIEHAITKTHVETSAVTTTERTIGSETDRFEQGLLISREPRRKPQPDPPMFMKTRHELGVP
jgi:hypothetical protein